MNPELDFFFQATKKWQQELNLLRKLVLDCQLQEEKKWGVPCYTLQSKNILIIHDFKEYCALNFFKGALLSNADGILTQPTENSQSARQIRISSVQQIMEWESAIRATIFEAIEIEKAGLQVPSKPVEAFEMPEEFQAKLNQSPALNTAFNALTPGRQKAYLLHFAEAKQAKTREARIDKYTQRILDGKGFTDCVCGLSKRMPGCDGSHKFLKKD